MSASAHPGRTPAAEAARWNPRIVVFACNWCSYAGADTARVSRIEHEPHFRMIRVMCSGRIEPGFVLRAFEKGADGVLVSGCHFGDCHYIFGNERAVEQFEKTRVWGMVVLFGLVIGGMFFGIFAPSEAAAIGAFGSFVLNAVRGQLKRSVLVTSLARSVRITCSVMFVIVGALVFNVFLATSGFASAFTNWLTGLPVSRWVILVLSLLMYIPLGAFMDELALMMLTLPILAPVISGLGFDLVWYGILVTVMLQFGLLTPPIALAA